MKRQGVQRHGSGSSCEAKEKKRADRKRNGVANPRFDSQRMGEEWDSLAKQRKGRAATRDGVELHGMELINKKWHGVIWFHSRNCINFWKK